MPIMDASLTTMQKYVLLVCGAVFTLIPHTEQGAIDHRGYILYCPCMGRFGNQADHFLGVLSWAKTLDRTLVIPPWVEYRFGEPISFQVPFKTYFKVEEVARYHRVVTMEDFMRDIAPAIWPPGKRTVYCYMERKDGGCDAKFGNPFGPFWDTFGVDFDRSEFYGPLSPGSDDPFELDRWNKRFPVLEHHVMAFMGAPARFPVDPDDRALHKYLRWSDDIVSRATRFISDEIESPYIGIHMRNGVDWSNACSHMEEGRSELFASSQCLGDRGQHGRLYHELCYPADDTVVNQVAAYVVKYKAKTVFIATDDRDLMSKFQRKIKKTKFVRLPEDSPHVDLAIVGQADYAIVNCVSTFSAFITRERTIKGLPTGFWAFPPSQIKNEAIKDEL